MNWDDPESRAALVESVGAKEYNRLFEEHRRSSRAALVNGYAIRPVGSRFGQLYFIEGANVGFHELEVAKSHALTLPKGSAT